VVEIPFASAATLLRMKQTYRDKDEVDRLFLKRLLAEREKNTGQPSDTDPGGV